MRLRRRCRQWRFPRSLAAIALCALNVGAACDGCDGASAASIPGAVYYHEDHLQGVAFETGDDGEVLSESSYDPYGGALLASNEPYAFTGKERDPDTGLYDFGARVYDPRLGLFLSPDPAVLEDPELALSDPQLLAPYSYVRNNPTSHVDPDGRLPHILAGALVGSAIGGGGYLIKAAFTGQFSVKGAFAATAGGAVAGAVAAATGGASLIVQGVASGIAGGITQRAIETKSLSATLSPQAVAVDAALGGASGLAVKAVTSVARPVVSAIKANIARRGGVAASRPVASAPAAGAATQGAASPRFLTAGSEVPNAGGVIRSFAQQGDRIHYRVFSSSQQGRFLTAVPPRSSAFAREALALPPANEATMIQEVLVPHGTILQRSRAIPAFGARGGAEQFELLQTIPTENFGPGTPLR